MTTRHGLFALTALFVSLSLFVVVSCGGGDDDNDAADDDATDDDSDDGADDDDSDESVWTDEVTGLGWQNGSEVGGEEYNPDTALAYCENLVWAGFDDWRLPTISELRSLIRGCADTATGGACQVRDDCTNTKCWTARCGCPDSGGPGTGGAYWPEELSGAIDYYWSSTPIPDDPGNGWPVNFQFAAVYEEQIPFYAARCVRGEGSGITDDTGEAYKAGHFIMADLEFTPVTNAVCAIVALDGEPLDEPYIVDSGANGFCEAIFNFPSGTYSMDVTAPGYRDMHVVNLPTLPWDEGGGAPVWADIMLNDATLAERADAAGVTQDPSKGIVWGTAHWLDDVDVFSPSYDAMVGCATVTPDTDLFYVDGATIPDPALTQTGTQIAGWYAFNVEPGMVEYVMTADGNAESTGEATVYPDALTIVMSKFRAPEYPENPMPDGCL